MQRRSTVRVHAHASALRTSTPIVVSATGGGGGGFALQPDREPLQNPDGLRPWQLGLRGRETARKRGFPQTVRWRIAHRVAESEEYTSIVSGPRKPTQVLIAATKVKISIVTTFWPRDSY